MRCQSCSKEIEVAATTSNNETLSFCTDSLTKENLIEEEVSVQSKIAATNDQIIEVELPNGKIEKFNSVNDLKDNIVCGSILKDFKVRQVLSSMSEKQKEKVEWANVEDFSEDLFELKTLYKPVWAHTMKGLFYGSVAGIILKTLDTTYLFFSLDPTVGFVWLLVIGSLFVKKWWAPLAVVFFAMKIGIRVNLFVTVFSVALIGAVFGAPMGALIGTIVGYIRVNKIHRAPDAATEGLKPLLAGIMAPILSLGILIPFYFFWLQPKILEWF